jgi:acetyl-CoA carboxylase biotin carboxyl carrier protein
MDLKLIQQLITKLEASKLKKLVVKEGDFELQLEKEGEAPVYHSVPVRAEPAFTSEVPQKGERGANCKIDGDNCIASPMVGTFYTSPEPGKPPYVKVGDKVDHNTILCVIEAMKVMNEIKSNKVGVMVEVLVDNGQAVEFNQPLFRLK